MVTIFGYYPVTHAVICQLHVRHVIGLKYTHARMHYTRMYVCTHTLLFTQWQFVHWGFPQGITPTYNNNFLYICAPLQCIANTAQLNDIHTCTCIGIHVHATCLCVRGSCNACINVCFNFWHVLLRLLIILLFFLKCALAHDFSCKTTEIEHGTVVSQFITHV